MLKTEKFILCVAYVAVLMSVGSAITPQEYEGNITFYGFNSNAPLGFVSTFDTNITDQGCDPNGLFAMIVHGWNEGIATPWVNITVSNLLRYRGGCVFVMDYTKLANVTDYYVLVQNFPGIAAVLLKKLKQIGTSGQQYCFAFSFGSRLCMDAGKKFANQTGQMIDRMDLCDPAGPGFDQYVDPKPAAKNVACINTSTDKGSVIYNCHQNFRMGQCGYSQPGVGPAPLGNHGLCPYFYNLAFENNFTVNNFNLCTSSRLAPNVTIDVKMGYMGNFNRSLVVGDIFIATAQYPPFVMTSNTIDNYLGNILRAIQD